MSLFQEWVMLFHTNPVAQVFQNAVRCFALLWRKETPLSQLLIRGRNREIQKNKVKLLVRLKA